MKKYLTAILVLFLFSYISWANDDEILAKDIKIVPIKKTEKFIDYLYTHKKEYRVREPIKFVLKLKKNAYIYIVNISKRNHHAYKILPNKYQRYNYYKANIKYVIPSKSDPYNFVPDSIGEEIVYVIASEKKLDNLPSFGNFKSKGSFFEEATEKEAERFVKDIQVIPKEQFGMEIRKIIIPVKPKIHKQIFVSTGKYVYSAKENVPIFIKKNFNESIHIYVYDENGNLEKSKIVKKKQTQLKVKLNKEGAFSVIAVYLPNDKSIDINCLKSELNSKCDKSLECMKPYIYNIHTFIIKGE